MSTLVQLAEDLARKYHAGQFRRDGVTPYIEHPKAVAHVLRNERPEVIATAWLHDVIEDGENLGSTDLLRDGVPPVVVSAVSFLTRGTETYGEYIAAIRENPIARKVKIADMLHNLSDSPTPKQIRKYASALLKLVDE